MHILFEMEIEEEPSIAAKIIADIVEFKGRILHRRWSRGPHESIVNNLHNRFNDPY